MGGRVGQGPASHNAQQTGPGGWEVFGVTAPDIALTANIEDFFGVALERALAGRQLPATVAAVRYVVVLLCDFARADNEHRPVLERPLTLLFRDALETAGAERFRRLRRLGDGILYVLGFFGSSVSRRGADRGYVMTVGSSANRHAAAMLSVGGGGQAGTDVLGELAVKYPGFVDVISDIADDVAVSAARTDEAVVRLYERWLETGSERLAERLGALGVVPVSSRRGVH